jgi:hypothetical protein
MARFGLTSLLPACRKGAFRLKPPDAANARARVLDGCSYGGVVGREAVLFTTPLDCKEVATTAAPANVNAAKDQDGCPVWVLV